MYSWRQRMLWSLDPRPTEANHHLHYGFSLSVSQAHIDFHQILYRADCTNQDISLLLSTSSHLWLLQFTLALPFPQHKILLLKNMARLQRRHLSLYFLLWARSGNVSSGVLNSDLSAKMFTAFNLPSRILWAKVMVGSLLPKVPSSSLRLQQNSRGISNIRLLIILGDLFHKYFRWVSINIWQHRSNWNMFSKITAFRLRSENFWSNSAFPN